MKNCKNQLLCYEESKICDGFNDCLNKDDEKNCAGKNLIISQL